MTDKQKEVLERFFSNEENKETLLLALREEIDSVTLNNLRKAAMIQQEAGDNKLLGEKVNNIFLAEGIIAGAIKKLSDKYFKEEEEEVEEKENPAK